MPAIRVALASLVLLALVGAGAWHRAERESARRAAQVETSLLRKQLLEGSEVRRLAPGAGVSLQPIRVQGIDRAALARLAEVPGHGIYARRCASCHVAPDPGARAANDWYRVMERMQRHMDRAGVIPPDTTEYVAILEFLRAAASQ
jgi:cytochrome c5